MNKGRIRMSKTAKKSSQKNNYSENNNFPQVVDIDKLAYANDDDLANHSSYLRAERERATRLGMNPTPWDIEICYVQREMMIREDRRLAHEKYLRTNPDSYDNDLPLEGQQSYN